MCFKTDNQAYSFKSWDSSYDRAKKIENSGNDPDGSLQIAAGGEFDKNTGTVHGGEKPPADTPDENDPQVRSRRNAEALRALTGQGRKSMFLTTSLGELKSSTTKLGGG